MIRRIERTASRRTTASRAACWGRVAALSLAAWCAAAPAQKLVPSPTLNRVVNDNAAMLNDQQEAALDASLSKYRVKNGTRIVVLTVASTGAEPIDEYAARVARDWAAAHAGDDNVVFVVVARDNRPDFNRARVHAGGPAAQKLVETDAERIVAEDMLPRFAVLDYNGAFVAGVDRIKSLLAGNAFPLPPPPAPEPRNESRALIAAAAGAGGGFLALLVVALPIVRVRSRRIAYLTGRRALNRSFEPMIVGRFRRRAAVEPEDGGNGFGGGFGANRGFAGGGGDFSGGGSSGFW